MNELNQSFKISADKAKELFSNSCDISILINRVGIVLDIFVNQNFRIPTNTKDWLHKNIKNYLTPESIEKLANLLINAWEPQNTNERPIELNHIDDTNWEFPIAYSVTILDEKTILLSGRDLRIIAEMQQQLINSQLSLEKEYEKYKGYDTRFRVILENSDEHILLVDAHNCQITDANASAAKLLGLDVDSLINSELHLAFKNQDKESLLTTLKSKNGLVPIKPGKYVVKNGNREVMIFPTVFRANNDMLIICKLAPIESYLSATEEFLAALQSLYINSPDGIIFTDTTGSISYANESFLSICDVPDVNDIRSKSLGDFLARGGIDLKVLIENTVAKGVMQFYSSKIQTNFGRQTLVEISATFLGEKNNPAFAFVIKDTSHLDLNRNGTDTVSEKALQNVMKLVGSAPLKELVADTSDVVERLCIETAIELTRNNRVAAADMLGVSRQSLYVKLRKYDLMSKDVDTY